MYKDKQILSIIPARFGSKGLPKKNVLPLCGKPLIAWSIEASQQSRFIDSCIVSTDDKEIANIAKKYGCEVPFMRPDDLATDEASSNDVVLHALEMIGQKYDIVLVLQPTSPLRKAEDIDHALAFMDQKKAPALVSVCKSNKPLYWHHTVENNGTLKPVFHSNTIITNRQEMTPTYLPNGALYIAVADYFKDKKTFYTDATLAYIMPPERSVDIDNQIDLYVADAIVSSK